ncbi:DNA primase [Dongia deserti]|uniref:DNA primase n=1 Tax=Dongia deserti TaxID=2268030 RepID=UPI000E654168|nr:DNA primase [Dongia deserti]
MALPPRFLDELRGRVSITDIVGRRVRLIRKGRGESTGLCPFHNEKTPSFTVTEDKGFFHCFGCGAHGDVIGFVMRSEGLEFPQAVEKLAAEAGMQVPRETPEERERAERQATLGGAVEFAAKHFEQQLRASAGRLGLEYLKRRGLTDDTMRRFRLGFAPDNRTGLKAALEKAGIPEAIAIEAGLLIKPEDGGHAYDRFRGRVMFPILDRRGQAIAFGGRILDQGEPKYLNSPETPLFHKGRVLYGLSHAQKTARETNEIIVVEGYMDVIALAQAGISNAVAPLGTALTEEQIALLWRMAQEPILCFDGDNAGQRAAARAADRAIPLLKPGLSLRFAWMPAGEDPDSLVRAKGAAGFREALSRMEPLVEALWRQVLADRPLDTPERRAGFRKDLGEAVGRIADKSVAEAYRQEIQRRLDELFRPQGKAGFQAPAQFGVQKGRFGGRQPVVPIGGEAARRGITSMQRIPYELILIALVNHPDLISRHCEAVGEVDFPRGDLDSLKRAVIDLAAGQPHLDAKGFRNHLNNLGFAATLEALVARTGHMKFTLPSADLNSAEEGLLHVIGLLREKLSVKPELAATAQALENAMANPGDPTAETTALSRFEAARQMTLDGESQRRDLDRAPGWGGED